jgi:hypothetical protein
MIFGRGTKYVHIACSKNFGQKTPYGAGVYFTWLSLVVYVKCEDTMVI